MAIAVLGVTVGMFAFLVSLILPGVTLLESCVIYVTMSVATLALGAINIACLPQTRTDS